MGSGTSGKPDYHKKITMDDLIRMVVGPDSYYFGEEYQRAVRESREAREERDRATEEWKKLSEAVNKEVVVDPELGRDLSQLIGLYTDKGKALVPKRNEAMNKMTEAEHRWMEKRDAVDDLVQKAREIQLRKGVDESSVSAPTQKSYKGFQMDTGTPYYQDKLARGQAIIVEMSPKTYIEFTAKKIFNRSSMESTVQGTAPENVKKYASMMKKGTKFYMPVLNFQDNGQEGRHRALAAMLNGYKKIPVLVVRRG